MPKRVFGGKQPALNFDPMQWSQETFMGAAPCCKTKKREDIRWKTSMQREKNALISHINIQLYENTHLGKGWA